MKKYLFLLLLVLGLTLSGCGSADYEMGEEYYNPDNFSDTDTEFSDPDPVVNQPTDAGGDNSTGDSADPIPALENRKIIYRANLEMEVMDPKEVYDEVLDTIDEYTAYIEEASIRTDYYNVTIRVLSTEFDDFVEALKTSGELVAYSKTSEDITNTYSTFEAQKTALETRHTRILELIAQADNLNTILQLEEERYEIEADLNYIGTKLANYDSLVDYSTVTLKITEAKEEIIVLARTEQPSVKFTEINNNDMTLEVYNRSEENITLEIDVYLNGEFVEEYKENMFADSKTIVTFDELKSDNEYTFKVTASASNHRSSLTETYREETLKTYGNKTVNTFTGSVDLLVMAFEFIGLAITGMVPFAAVGAVIYFPVRYIQKKRKSDDVEIIKEKEE